MVLGVEREHVLVANKLIFGDDGPTVRGDRGGEDDQAEGGGGGGHGGNGRGGGRKRKHHSWLFFSRPPTSTFQNQQSRREALTTSATTFLPLRPKRDLEGGKGQTVGETFFDAGRRKGRGGRTKKATLLLLLRGSAATVADGRGGRGKGEGGPLIRIVDWAKEEPARADRISPSLPRPLCKYTSMLVVTFLQGVAGLVADPGYCGFVH